MSSATASPIWPIANACCARIAPGPEPPDRSASQFAKRVRITPTAGITPASSAASDGRSDCKDCCSEVDLDALKPGHRGRPEQHDHADERDRKDESCGAAGDREGGRFEDHLHGQPATTRTKRGPDRKLTAATDTACQQQIRDVGAGQQKNERDCRDQQADRASRARRDLLDERHDVCAPRPIVWKLALDLLLDVIDLAIRGLDRRSDRKPPDDREIVRASLTSLEVRRMRDPQLGLLRRRRAAQYHRGRTDEFRRHHADDLGRHPVDRNRVSDDAAVLPKAPPPQPVANHHDGTTVGAILLRQKPAAHPRLHTEGGQQARCHPRRADAFGLRPTHRHIPPLESPHRRKRLRPLLPLVQVRRRRVHHRQRNGRRGFPDDREPIGRGVGNRPQEDAIGDGENCGGGADAEGECRDRNRRKAGPPDHQAKPIAKILEHTAASVCI